MADQHPASLPIDPARTRAVLETLGLPHWFPVIDGLLTRYGLLQPLLDGEALADLAMDYDAMMLALDEAAGVGADDRRLARLLAGQPLLRRRFRCGPVSLSILDDLSVLVGCPDPIACRYDLLTPSTRLARELLGWMHDARVG